MAIIEFKHTKVIEKKITFEEFYHVVRKIIGFIDTKITNKPRVTNYVCTDPSVYTKLRAKKMVGIFYDYTVQELQEKWTNIYSIKTVISTENGIVIKVYADLASHSKHEIITKGFAPTEMREKLLQLNVRYDLYLF